MLYVCTLHAQTQTRAHAVHTQTYTHTHTQESEASQLLVKIEATKKISSLHEELDTVHVTLVNANCALSGTLKRRRRR